MNEYFDELKWSQALKSPTWYIELKPEYDRLINLIKLVPANRHLIKEAIYSFFERALADAAVSLAPTGPNMDAERKPVDTIVIHHTKNSPGMSWRRLSAMHLIRLYTGYEGRKENQEKIKMERKPIYSNHFRKHSFGEEQVFYSYHWLIREDGDCERLLKDEEIGWQAGDWDINCRSVAICIDNDHENSSPSPVVIEAIARLIKSRYSHIQPERIFGHREINKNTTCPGNFFLPEWKEKLLAFMR